MGGGGMLFMLYALWPYCCCCCCEPYQPACEYRARRGAKHCERHNSQMGERTRAEEHRCKGREGITYAVISHRTETLLDAVASVEVAANHPQQDDQNKDGEEHPSNNVTGLRRINSLAYPCSETARPQTKYAPRCTRKEQSHRRRCK